MSARSQEMGNKILLLGIEIDDTDATALLLPVLRRISALDIAALGQNQHRLFVSDQIFRVKFLDAMLHDYHYLKHGVASNFVTKWKADWLFAKGHERKGKGQYSAYSRFIALTIIGVFFVPYVLIKRGKITKTQKKEFLKEYNLLIK